VKRLLLKETTGQWPFDIRIILFFITFSLSSYAFNIFIKWTIPRNHELVYIELIFMIVILSGISFSFGSVLKWFSFGWMFLAFTYFITETSIQHKFPIFDFNNVVVFAGVAVMVWLTHYFSKIHSKVNRC
jgi:hypothetical protein